MTKTLSQQIQSIFAKISGWFQNSRNAFLFSIVYCLVATLLVYYNPRSLPAFILFLASGYLIFALKMNITQKAVLGVILALLIIPVVGIRNISYLGVFFQIAMFSGLALGLNIVVGFTGMLNLGYTAFFLVGSYLWAFFGSQQMFMLNAIPGTQPETTQYYLPANSFYLFLFLGLGAAALVGFLLGLPVLRVRGDYLAIVTLGFGEVLRVTANNLDHPINLTNGPQGITQIQRPLLPAGLVQGLGNFMAPVVGHVASQDEFYNVFFYLLALVIILLIILAVVRLNDSRIGRAWMAIREDELAAAAMGIPVVSYKLAAFSVGASFAGIMGVCFAASQTFVSPESFSFMQSIGVLSMVILGGLGSIPGVILGATIVIMLNFQVLQQLSLWLNGLRQSGAVIPIINFAWQNLSPQLDPAQYQRMLFGAILILMMIYRPEGILPPKLRKHEKPIPTEPAPSQITPSETVPSQSMPNEPAQIVTDPPVEGEAEAEHGAA
jgi:branched-chain amino acid transport system permease protein